MKDATTYYFRAGDTTGTTAAAEAFPAVGQFHPVDAEAKGCQRGKKGQEQAGSSVYAADGFLKCQFLPKLLTPQSSEDCGDTAPAEQSFYDSLSQLCAHYHIGPIPTRGYSYPYNISLALWDVGRKLQSSVEHWHAFELLRTEGNVTISCTERMDMGMYLYYIPVIPIYRMLHDPRRKQSAGLLLSVCRYLYHIANIPYYRDPGSFLYWQYEMLAEWIEDEEDCEEKAEQVRQMEDARRIGDYINRKLIGKQQPKTFHEDLMHFRPGDDFDKECLDLATSAFDLYTQFPDQSIFRNGSREDELEDYNEYYHGEILTMNKYISFIADSSGLLYENLFSSINTDFNDCHLKEEPCINKHFNGSPVSGDFTFEKRLFMLIDDLCGLLEKY